MLFALLFGKGLAVLSRRIGAVALEALGKGKGILLPDHGHDLADRAVALLEGALGDLHPCIAIITRLALSCGHQCPTRVVPSLAVIVTVSFAFFSRDDAHRRSLLMRSLFPFDPARCSFVRIENLGSSRSIATCIR